MLLRPSEPSQLLDARHAVAVVTQTVLPRNTRVDIPTQLRLHDASVLPDSRGDATAHVVSFEVSLVSMQNEHVGRDDVIHVHEIASLDAILVDNQRIIRKRPAHKDAA